MWGWVVGTSVIVLWLALVRVLEKVKKPLSEARGDVGFVGVTLVVVATIPFGLVPAVVLPVVAFFAFLDDELILPDDSFLKELLRGDNIPQSVEFVDKKTDMKSCTQPRRLRNYEGQLMEYHNDCGPECVTIPAILKRSTMLFADNQLCGTRVVRDDGSFGPYVFKTYAEFFRLVDICERNLGGRKKLKRLGLFAKNCEDYCVAMFAALKAGIVLVPLYDSLGVEAIRYVVKEAELTTVCVSEENLEIIIRLKSAPSFDQDNDAAICDALTTAYVFEDRALPPSSPKRVNRGPRQCLGIDIVPFETLLEERKSTSYTEPIIKKEDLAYILYTSGTSGQPKGVLLTQGSVVSTAAALVTTVVVNEDDVHLSYLPLAHAFEIAVVLAGVQRGASVGFYHGNVKELTADAQALKPTMFIGVPRVFARVTQIIRQQFALKPLPIRRLCYHALRTQILNVRQHNARLMIYDLLVFRQVKAALGGRVRIMCTGSAPLAPSIQELVKVCFDVPMVEGFGLSETSGVCCAMYGGIDGKFDASVGHVGPPLACSEIKLESCPDLGFTIHDAEGPRGEVLVRGPNVSKGYFNNPELTREVFDDDGWFHTGDIGRFNPNGTLSIISRKKELFKLSQGEYVNPGQLEDIMKNVPVVGQIYVHGDSLESQLVAIVVPDPLELIPRLRRGAIPSIRVGELPVLSPDLETWLEPYHKLCQSEEYGPLIKQYVLDQMTQAAKTAELAGFLYIKAIHIESKLNHLLQVFSVESGHLTPTFKLRRNKIAQDFQPIIQSLYKNLKN